MQAVQSKPGTATSRFLQRLHDPSKPVLVFDGATGTSLQQMDLTADDFGGEALEGCNENLVITRPDAVQAALEAGVDERLRRRRGAGVAAVARRLDEALGRGPEPGLRGDGHERGRRARGVPGTAPHSP